MTIARRGETLSGTMADDRKVVWVLGAGFSKGLGGPLLGDLLSHESRRVLTARFRNVKAAGGIVEESSKEWNEAVTLMGPDAVDTDTIYQLFHATGDDGAPLWQDAEHFLDYLDAQTDAETSTHDLWILASRARGRLIGTSRPDPLQLQHTARRLIAAQCCSFLRQNPPTLERWQPYKRWISELSHCDTIISFNYDLVVETASEQALKDDLGGRVHVLTFEHGSTLVNELHMAKTQDAPVLVKLHGSVDWMHDREKKVLPYKRAGREHSVTAGDGEKLSIATPGRTKQEMIRGDLKALWAFARDKIIEAEIVVFMGYRFPPSDAQARHVLLDAISVNRPVSSTDPDARGRNRLTLYTVLGNDRLGIDSARRLSGLLSFAAQRGGREPKIGYKVIESPLFAEDFMTVWSRGALFDE